MMRFLNVFFCLLLASIQSVVASENARPLQPLLGKLSEPSLAMVDAAFQGIVEGENIDFHVHVVGLGDTVTVFEDEMDANTVGECRASDFAGSPVYINERRFSFWRNPMLFAKTRFLMKATGITQGLWDSLDRAAANNNYVNHLLGLVGNYRPRSDKPGKFLLLAMDGHYVDGVIDWAQTDIRVPNKYVIRLSDCMNRLYQQRHRTHFSPFMPAISIHPEREDAVDALRMFSTDSRYLKWLPNTMNINPASGKIKVFLNEMKARDVTLVTHTGHEDATEALEEHQRYGNPTLHQSALEHGMKVIMAHAGYKGSSFHHAHGEEHENSELFNDMLESYPNNLKGGLSATVFVEHSNCAADLGYSCLGNTSPLANQLKRILLDKDQRYAERMVYGSDYPLPSIGLLKPTRELMYRGFLSQEQARLLNEIWGVNPLLYDFVLKRTIRHPENINKQLPASMFDKPEWPILGF
ncbi:hypothetical protein ACFL2V_10775 [Pseudomonadota bacterium]